MYKKIFSLLFLILFFVSCKGKGALMIFKTLENEGVPPSVIFAGVIIIAIIGLIIWANQNRALAGFILFIAAVLIIGYISYNNYKDNKYIEQIEKKNIERKEKEVEKVREEKKRVSEDKRIKKENRIKTSKESGDSKIYTIIHKISNLNIEYIKLGEMLENKKPIKEVLQKPVFENITRPIKDEFETTANFNKRILTYKKKVKKNKQDYNKELIKFKILKKNDEKNYNKVVNEFIRSIKEKQHKIIVKQNDLLKESFVINQESKLFPEIIINKYNADREVFDIVVVNKLKCSLKVKLGLAREFKNNFYKFTKESGIKLLYINNKLQYKYTYIKILFNDKVYQIDLLQKQKKGNVLKLFLSTYNNDKLVFVLDNAEIKNTSESQRILYVPKETEKRTDYKVKQEQKNIKKTNKLFKLSKVDIPKVETVNISKINTELRKQYNRNLTNISINIDSNIEKIRGTINAKISISSKGEIHITKLSSDDISIVPANRKNDILNIIYKYFNQLKVEIPKDSQNKNVKVSPFYFNYKVGMYKNKIILRKN